ncbi:MAG: single-stranded DNA-binding protein [Phycisphaeraceae bacterium]|nr:MAG: single-stranded DNA-binding protein [Phycisphaeraceae bacterium]
MAGNFNKVLLMGNLTRDVELKHLSPEVAVANIGLAVNRRFRTREGENREETTFVDCEAWGRTAEVMAQYLAKGRPVFIEGRLKLDTWQDKDGGNRSKLKVVIENFQFVDSRGEGGGGGGAPRSGSGGAPARQGAGQQSSSNSGDEAFYEPIEEDDIPF